MVRKRRRDSDSPVSVELPPEPPLVYVIISGDEESFPGTHDKYLLKEHLQERRCLCWLACGGIVMSGEGERERPRETGKREAEEREEMKESDDEKVERQQRQTREEIQKVRRDRNDGEAADRGILAKEVGERRNQRRGRERVERRQQMRQEIREVGRDRKDGEAAV